MKVSLAIPYRSDDPARILALQRVLLHYGDLLDAGVANIHVTANEGKFSRTAARNVAVEEAIAADQPDVVAVIDADCIVPLGNLLDGCRSAVERQIAVLPHDHFLELTQQGTQRALHEPDFGKWRESWCVQPDFGRSRPSGVVIFPVGVWRSVGGYDERFSGWGYEDAAMLLALQISGGWSRGKGEIWHLWHPAGERSIVNLDDKKLFNRYREAVSDERVLRALIDERVGSTLSL